MIPESHFQQAERKIIPKVGYGQHLGRLQPDLSMLD